MKNGFNIKNIWLPPGYFYLPEGKNLFLKISDVLNKRHSTNSVVVTESIIEEINIKYREILLIKPPFNIEECIPHVANVRNFKLGNNLTNSIHSARLIKTIFIYEEGKLIDGSPFVSFSSAHKALGLKSSSNTCNRYLDTGRLYKSKYIFTSKPILKV